MDLIKYVDENYKSNGILKKYIENEFEKEKVVDKIYLFLTNYSWWAGKKR